MFDSDEIILLKAVFRNNSKESLAKLAQYLKSEYGYDAEIVEEDTFMLCCQVYARRDLKSQKELLKIFDRLGQEYGCPFQGWRHTLLRSSLH